MNTKPSSFSIPATFCLTDMLPRSHSCAPPDNPTHFADHCWTQCHYATVNAYRLGLYKRTVETTCSIILYLCSPSNLPRSSQLASSTAPAPAYSRYLDPIVTLEARAASCRLAMTEVLAYSDSSTSAIRFSVPPSKTSFRWALRRRWVTHRRSFSRS